MQIYTFINIRVLLLYLKYVTNVFSNFLCVLDKRDVIFNLTSTNDSIQLSDFEDYPPNIESEAEIIISKGTYNDIPT